ncbi:uroporphyrinogen decarboxylase family protein [Clostridium formicaceticum]|uniref:Uroporphyrinogen decarboxylase n=1 Tax=Clostridium formicaceticum TaxID=1497 RepID=A0AAC9WHN2_9CLOT|nr:uroporphyrinogen decarboxylase family protein [Clostridium formicaceticum]AOY74769.1 uroporphyrinogen decarboxylase [Clostridium formicaceticum]ARE89158.1 Uroporphyrinogen decarboxylase (URO-D) [Clostridium formicaceticum]
MSDMLALDTITLAQERTQLFRDLVDNKIPKRVPIGAVRFSSEFAIQYADKDLAKEQWDTARLEEILDKVCQDFASDTLPLSSIRFPSYYKILGAKTFVMGSSGFLQHPEVHGLEPEEYDEFIASPYDCIMEKVMPRLYTALDTNPVEKSLVLAKAFKAYYDETGNMGKIFAALSQKHGYAPPLFTGATEAPFDLVADLIRGFKGVTSDLRRCPDKLAAACEAVTPMMVKKGVPKNPSKYASTFIPLHMAPYIRPKDFEKFYWPSFKKLIEDMAAAGQPSTLFVEHDWMRYIDYLYELPENTRMMFEFGDPKVVKEKLGKKHILTGFYPLTLLKTGTKEQCVDKAKELIDILAPGGKYYFGFDKSIITVDSVNIENLQAVVQYVAENANY